MKIQRFPLGPMKTNCYFIIDESTRKAAVVDPGFEGEVILKKLRERELICETILLTHGHYDHLTALTEVWEQTGAAVCIHKNDSGAIEGQRRHYMTAEELGNVPPVRVRILQDGDNISVGGISITVVHTPGHTPGSVCFQVTDMNPKNAVLITGDTLFRDSIGRYDLPGGDFSALQTSLSKLAALEGNWNVYPGHGSTSDLNRERRFNIYLN